MVQARKSTEMLKRIVYLTITILWLTAVGMLINRYHGHGLTAADGPGSGIPPGFLKEQWMGVYMKGEKIGYSFRKLEPSNGAYRLSEALKMKLKVMDLEKEIETVIEASLDDRLALLDFDARIISDFTVHVTGRVEGQRLVITMDTDGERRTRSLDLKEVPTLEAVLPQGLIREGLREGRKISMPVVDPASMSLKEMTMEVAGREPVMSMGKTWDAYRLKGSMEGLEFTVWATGDGTVLKEESPLGLTLIREEKEEAIELGRPSLDIIAQTSVAFNLSLPPETQYLKVRLSGIKTGGLALEGGRQSLRGDVLEIRRERLDSVKPSVSAAPGEEYLEETMTVQTKDPAVISKAGEILGGVTDNLRKARLISEWVYGNIKKVPVISIPSATEVLRSRRGDCNEHTVLYAALARASGIPTRIAVGLAHRDGAFYYHAWPEVHLGGWVAVDPTFGQFPADAAHIRLITGDLQEQTRLLSIIGEIRLEGLAYR
jgi:hypothetical protein